MEKEGITKTFASLKEGKNGGKKSKATKICGNEYKILILIINILVFHLL